MATDSGQDFPWRVRIEAIHAPFWPMVTFFFKAIAALLLASVPFWILMVVFNRAVSF